MTEAIRYPYLPEGKQYLYVPADDPCMALARATARDKSLDKTMPGGAVIARDCLILGMGANGSAFHEEHGCERVRLGCKSGQGYDLCEGCHPKNHSEPTAIADALRDGQNVHGADLYLWGHWWCCKDCWDTMIAAGIRNVYLLEGSERLFNKDHPDNIVGRQFSP